MVTAIREWPLVKLRLFVAIFMLKNYYLVEIIVEKSLGKAALTLIGITV